MATGAGPNVCFNAPQQFQLGWADALVDFDDNGVPMGKWENVWLPSQGLDPISLMRLHLSVR